MTTKPSVYNVPRVQGSLIRAARKARGFSQEQLAEMVVVDPSKIGRIERSQGLSDHYVPDVWTIEKIAEILDVPPINFYDIVEIERFMSGKRSSPLIRDDESKKSNHDKHHEVESLTPELYKIIETIPKSLDRKQFRFSFRSPKRWWPVQPTVSELFKFNLESGNCVSETASIYSDHFTKRNVTVLFASGELASQVLGIPESSEIEVLAKFKYGVIIDEYHVRDLDPGEPKIYEDVKGFVIDKILSVSRP